MCWRGVQRPCTPDLEHEEWRKFEYYRNDLALAAPREQTPCAREHCKRLSLADFIRKYESPNLPVMIDGICDDWPATKAWTAQVRHN